MIQIMKSDIRGELLACYNCGECGICDQGCTDKDPQIAYLVGKKEEVYFQCDVDVVDDETEEDRALARADEKIKYDKENPYGTY